LKNFLLHAKTKESFSLVLVKRAQGVANSLQGHGTESHREIFLKFDEKLKSPTKFIQKNILSV
jgi:hypothetical protein